MEHLGDLSRFRRECIDAQKVFDYVILSVGGTADVSIPNSEVTVRPFPPSNTAFCDALESDDNRIEDLKIKVLPEDSMCDEVSPQSRPDQTVELEDGEEVTLQWVSIEKTEVRFRISFKIVNRDTGATVYTFSAIGTIPGTMIPVENVLLCAPEGTMIDCSLLETSTLTAYNFGCSSSDDATTFTVRYNLCQAVQSYDNVKLEVYARLCQPREIISPVDTCEPVKPKQCPSIFPGKKDC